MHDVLFLPAVLWIAALFAVTVLRVIMAPSALDRILLLDTLPLLLAGLLGLLACGQAGTYYLDVALALVLLSFVGTVVTARLITDRKVL
jgi:multisubunit Na+/H+ antiporter MnhF subunit